MMRLPVVSCTAPGSIVNSGAVSPVTVVMCDAVRVKEITLPSAAVPSSPAVRVTPPVYVPDSLMCILVGTTCVAGVTSIVSEKVMLSTPVYRLSSDETNVGGVTS